MGITSNLFIIFLVITLVLTLANPTEWGSPLISLIVSFNSETGDVNLGGLWSQLVTMGAVALGVGIVAGMFYQDVTYVLFAGFVTFMLGFAVMPLNFFVSSDIPFFIKAIVGIPFSIMYILALVGWFRGNEL